MPLKYIFSFILLFIISALHANEDKPGLSGVVKDAATQAPLPGATVTVPDLKLSTTTDANGIYRFNALSNGRLTVQVSYIGYRSKVETVVVAGASAHDFLLSQSVVENENVTVTGVSSATRLKRTPVQVSIISRKDIQQSVGTNLLDIAAREPGVSIVTTGPAIAKPFIRGLGYNRVVIINDGIRQEGQQWGDEHGLEVDEYSTQKIEILRGPASLMYGSDAIGGVINILTNTPVANSTVQANLQTSFSGNNRMFGQYANVAGNINGFNWNAYGSIKSAGDYKNKYDGTVLNSRFGEKNFGGYIGVNKSWGFSHLLFSHFNQKLGMVEGERDEEGNLVLEGYTLTRSLEKGRIPLVPWQGIQHTKIALDNSFMLNDGGRIAALIGFQQNQRKEFAEPDAPNEPEAFFDLKTINYNLAYHLPENNNWKVSLGINGMQQQNKNRAAEAIIPDYN
ncbi:MAG TPA: TonB-dependent receptor plug domain-containing protein, partial [Niabella sp.]|nr:TonB-dependent receptor plug domain-containing protein [Niabella sp.]